MIEGALGPGACVGMHGLSFSSWQMIVYQQLVEVPVNPRHACRIRGGQPHVSSTHACKRSVAKVVCQTACNRAKKACTADPVHLGGAPRQVDLTYASSVAGTHRFKLCQFLPHFLRVDLPESPDQLQLALDPCQPCPTGLLGVPCHCCMLAPLLCLLLELGHLLLQTSDGLSQTRLQQHIMLLCCWWLKCCQDACKTTGGSDFQMGLQTVVMIKSDTVAFNTAIAAL